MSSPDLARFLSSSITPSSDFWIHTDTHCWILSIFPDFTQHLNQKKSGWQLDAFQDVAEALRSNRDTLEKDLLYITSIIRWNLPSWVVCFNLRNCTSASTCVVASRGMEILPPKPAPGRLQKHPMLWCRDTRSFGLLARAVETVVQMAGPPVVRMQEKASMGCWKCEGTIGFMAFSPTLNSRGASILLHGQPVEWDQRCLPRGCWIDREDGMAGGIEKQGRHCIIWCTYYTYVRIDVFLKYVSSKEIHSFRDV